MAAGWSVMDAINRNSKAAAEDRPKARFRTRDISVKKMYSKDSFSFCASSSGSLMFFVLYEFAMMICTISSCSSAGVRI